MRNLFLALLIVFAARPAFAQSTPPVSDELVKRIQQVALSALPRAICEDRKPCAPATEEEKKNPPLTVEETRRVMSRAVFSAFGQHCNADWQRRNFLPMMRYWRDTVKKNERQMALIALIHGIMQEQAAKAFAAKEPCSDELKKRIEAQLDFKL
ncbi:MAG: hypothetical protein KF794_04040 [Xanthobacteraceae bacterium]|nr:hypothetical protein [Xanthobacteraceae bacterium]QYK45873.1 MAG: hypothetical protein KF794_04040 [Xanthobacteraceae bacterium]HMN51972.1 hypothetical protein [Xanthobacteraceae bacterium]